MARKKQKSAKGTAPISSHPAFPAIVGLWFAALFGIGSLVLPTSVFEGFVAATGLNAILPAAAPPLGYTARAAIAVAIGALGLAAGLFLARKVVAAQSGNQERSRDLKLKQEDRHPDAPAKRPISARKELGSEGLGPVDDPWKFENEWADDDEDEHGEEYGDHEDDDAEYAGHAEEDVLPPVTSSVSGRVAGRRRALSVTDDSGPSEFLMNAPLPGHDPNDTLELDILELEPLVAEVAPEVAEAGTAGIEAPPHKSTPAPAEPARAFAIPETAQTTEPVTKNAAPAYDNIAITEQEESMTPTESHSNEQVGQAGKTAPETQALSDLGMAELVERFAKALQAKASRAENAFDAPARPDIPLPAGDGANPFADRAAEADLGGPALTAALPFTSPLSGHSAPPAQPGLAAQIDEPVAPMVFRPAGSTEQADDEDTVAEPFASETGNAQTPFSPFGEPQGMPSALQPFGFDDYEDEDEDEDGEEDAHAPLTIDFTSQRNFAPPGAVTGETEADEAPFALPASFASSKAEDTAEGTDDEEYEDGNDAYSSLLSMKSKLSGQEFVRIEDEADDTGLAPQPVVTFPGQNEASSSDTSARAPAPDAARPFDGPHAPTRTRQSATAATPQHNTADPSETERALREALEKLQRMSGAA